MIKSLMLGCFLFGCLFSYAQYAGYTSLKQPELFKKSFAAATSSTGSIQSDFTQDKSLTMLSEKIVSGGKFWFQQKDKMRMEYIRPFPYLMILTGDRIFIKDGQKENKISAGSNKVFQQVNRILLDCIGGRMLENPDFQSRLFENDGAFLIELRPVAKNLSDLYKNINITIDKKDYTVKTIEMFEISGDKTLIRFQNKILNAQIPESVFNIP